jgi:hypothetical protein
MDRNSFESKKVFFLYPHSVIQQELLRELVAHEYAVYLVTDHIKFRKIMGEYREPVIFINIDDYLSEEEWKDYISEIMESDDNDARISGPVMGSRTTPEGEVHVLLFGKDTSPDSRSRIHTFIYETLQTEINSKISSVS